MRTTDGVTAHPLEDRHRQALLDTATRTIGHALVTGERVLPTAPDEPALAQAAATFVTLEREAALLGCVGSLVPTEPLAINVARNAWNAAFGDPRLPAVTPADFTVMSIKVSVLSPLRALRARSWRDVHRAVRPGIDGLLLEAGRYRATLLPSVWDKVDDPAQFLDVLWHKAGLRPRDWLPGTRVRRYRTQELTTPGPRPFPVLVR